MRINYSVVLGISIFLLICVVFIVNSNHGSSCHVLHLLQLDSRVVIGYECNISHSLFGGKFKTITMAKTGFNKMHLSISKWSKRGQTSLLIPGHGPPVDITIYVDISRNPGPNSLATNSNPNVTSDVNLQVNSTIKTYTRGELCKLHCASKVSIPSFVLTSLKSAGILRY